MNRSNRFFGITVVLFFLGLFGLYVAFIRRQPDAQKVIFPTATSIPSKEIQQKRVGELPKDWSFVEVAEEEVLLKVEKKTTDTFAPSVALISDKLADKKDPKVYVEDLIKGARLTIPSLVILKNTTKLGDELYTRDITGYYLNGGKRINIRQQIHVAGNDVYTITGSYSALSKDLSLSKEIDEIFLKMFNTLLDE